MIEGLLGLIVAIAVAFFFGGRHVKKNAAKEQLKRNAEAHERAKGVKDEVGSLSDDAVTDRLRKRARK